MIGKWSLIIDMPFSRAPVPSVSIEVRLIKPDSDLLPIEEKFDTSVKIRPMWTCSRLLHPNCDVPGSTGVARLGIAFTIQCKL